MSDPIALDAETARKRLFDADDGRIAVSTPAGPQIIPVAFQHDAYEDRDIIIFRIAPNVFASGLAWGTNVAVEVDNLNSGELSGWVVQGFGRIEPITSAEIIEHIEDTLSWPRWHMTSPPQYFRIVITEVIGRSLGDLALTTHAS